MPRSRKNRSPVVTDADKIRLRRQFGANLRACRQRVGISQDELSLRSGLHRTQISVIERGKRSPRLNTIVRLARSLELDSTRDLLQGID